MYLMLKPERIRDLVHEGVATGKNSSAETTRRGTISVVAQQRFRYKYIYKYIYFKTYLIMLELIFDVTPSISQIVAFGWSCMILSARLCKFLSQRPTTTRIALSIKRWTFSDRHFDGFSIASNTSAPHAKSTFALAYWSHCVTSCSTTS